jgi:DNA-binding NarL/FixJ family response regulator
MIITKHQEEIIKLISQGKENKEIAKILGIHNKTVENIIRYTLKNTNSYNRTHLACKYLEMKFDREIQQVIKRMLQDG